jgi:transcriptional regulator with XRE-family HTH domain
MLTMASDQGPVIQSAILRSELVRLRKEERGMTQEQVAGNLEWSASKLIRVEGGHSSITKVDLDALLSQYGVTSESQRERLQALNRGAKETGWWEAYRGDAAPAYLNYIGYEAGAAFIRQFPGTVVPGLLQTPEYAEALTAISVEPVRVAPVVKLRMQRQSELAQREAPPRQYFVLDEAVIRRHIGIETDPAIMPNQLLHIAGRARDDDRVTVRVIPFSKGAHLGLSGPFTLLEFDGGLPDLLYLDTGREDITMIASDDRVSEYADTFEKLLESALPADQSLEFIRIAADEMS